MFFSEGAEEMLKHKIHISSIFLELKSAIFGIYQINLFTVVTDRYSSVPNRRAGRNERAGGKILEKP